MLSHINLYSPVPQREFIWLAEYVDGTHLSEFDFNTKQENDFYLIDKKTAVRFGLIGHGHKLFYETFGGHLKLGNGQIDLVYKTEEKEYFLTGQNEFYQDLITFKRAEAEINLLNSYGELSPVITEYVFGYKHKLQFEDISFHIKVLVGLSEKSPILTLRLVSNRDVEGSVGIKLNGIAVSELMANLTKEISQEFNWEMN
ncbi:hypothetical protein [Brevibacillus laterosporus]|uniref:hypothetical protein n=1 Tax=Brevibacillus laterosporus TaxID=1465 RepID=UPI002E25157C|nr:hypothetical protein [Brevibacillus laterosporus]MED1671008.1 hypothetical protein [Brevibacillus laterosporus]MED1720768.1 hypothetical protein [Brevibacillus laterosporus]